MSKDKIEFNERERVYKAAEYLGKLAGEYDYIDSLNSDDAEDAYDLYLDELNKDTRIYQSSEYEAVEANLELEKSRLTNNIRNNLTDPLTVKIMSNPNISKQLKKDIITENGYFEKKLIPDLLEKIESEVMKAVSEYCKEFSTENRSLSNEISKVVDSEDDVEIERWLRSNIPLLGVFRALIAEGIIGEETKRLEDIQTLIEETNKYKEEKTEEVFYNLPPEVIQELPQKRELLKSIKLDGHVTPNGKTYFTGYVYGYLDLDEKKSKTGATAMAYQELIINAGKNVDHPGDRNDNFMKVTDKEMKSIKQKIYGLKKISVPGVNDNHWRGLVYRDALPDGKSVFILYCVLIHTEYDERTG